MVAADYSIGSEQFVADSFFNRASGIPDEIKDLSREELARRCRDHDFRGLVARLVNGGRLKLGMLSAATDPYWSQCFCMTANVPAAYFGKTIFDIARTRYPNDIVRTLYEGAVDALCDVMQDNPDARWSMIRDKREAGTYHHFLRHPFGMPCCDSASYSASPDKSVCYLGYGISPLAYNLMPSFLLEMVKERKLLRVEEAIRKMTSLPASILGIERRGSIREGYYADLTILDWDKLEVQHDFGFPEKAPAGIAYTIVNGKIAYRGGKVAEGKNGRVLRKA